MIKIFVSLFLITLMAVPAMAKSELHTEYVKYELDGVKMEGYLAYDKSIDALRPGVLVIHEWNGIGDYVVSRANQLAGMGYVAFAADIYGVDVRPKTFEENRAAASAMYSDRSVLRARGNAALDVLMDHPVSSDSQIAAIGYCFGGSTVLELARSGAEVSGVVSFHGGLSTEKPEDMANFEGKILICHGADDPHVKTEDVLAFQKECRNAGVDWQFISYGGAVHGFTNPSNGDDPSSGVAYDPDTDRRSWQAMIAFFDEIFSI